MAENTDPQETEAEAEVEPTEVEAHVQYLLPLQSLGKPEPEGVAVDKSATSIVC